MKKLIVPTLWVAAMMSFGSLVQAQIPTTLGWTQIPNTTLGAVAPTDAQLASWGLNCASGCSPANVIAAWNSGVADTARNRLIVWGGGHGDYWGNEAYALNLTANPITLTRLNDPSSLVGWNGSCTGTYPDGKPASRHTYDGLTYEPNADAMITFSGSVAPCGSFPSDIWSFSLSTLGWNQRIQNSGMYSGVIPMSDYDPNTKLIFFHDSAQLWTYNALTNAFNAVSSFEGVYNNLGYPKLIIDPVHRFAFIIGGGNFYKYDISGAAPYTRQDISGTVSGCGAIFQGGNGLGLGAAWDTVQNKIVAWTGGSNVTVFDPVALACTSTVPNGNGPGVQQANGTYGRFRYFPALNIFALVNDWQQNAYVLRLTNGTTPPPPVITSAGSDTGTVGSAFSYQITATNSPTSFNATGLPAGLSVNTNTGLISGTPTAAATSSVGLSAANTGGTGSATLTLTINPVGPPPPPVITSAGSATGTVGSAFSYQITATNSPTSFNATGLPAGLSVNTNTGLISGTPTTAATSSVGLSAANTGGTGSATLTLTINPVGPPPPPVITSAGTATGTVGSAFSYQITATNNPTSFNATGLPAGLSVNTNTGLISGTPTTAATSSVGLSATNAGGTGNATLTLTIKPSGGGTPDADFAARCTAPGVVACQGFDATGDFAQATDPGSGFYYAADCPRLPATNCIVQDTNIFVSGGSSARWDIYSNTSANTEGDYIQHLTSAFGPGSTFYVQFQFRVDPNWLMNWESVAGTSPKISIIHNFIGGSCALEEITTNNSGGSGMLQMYGECGGTGFYTNTDGITPNPQDLGNWLLQQGFTDPAPFSGYDCEANPNGNGTFITGPGGGLGCFTFQPNIWYTLYWKVHVGDWGQPNSSVETWIAPYGQQLKKIINAVTWTLKQNSTGDPGFDAVTLTQFMTNKNPAAAHPTAHVWYDELIVSAQPIAAPGGTSPAYPVITSAGSATGTVGSAFSYQITATNNPTSFHATGLPVGLSINTNTGLISGTPTTAGTSSVGLSAVNSAGTGSATLALTINTASPPAPVITSALSAAGTVGTAFSYQITASNNPTSFNATGLAAGLSVNTSNGLISGTPTAAGSSNVTISATNAGGTGSATLALTVNSSPDTTPPSVPTNLTASAASFSQINLSWTASTDPDSPVAGYKVFRCQGSGCMPSVQVATPTTNNFSDTGLTASTAYAYAVSAFDAAGNVSALSAAASAVTSAAPAVAFVQGAASIPAGAGNIALAFPANVKAGDALIVAGTWGSASGNLACTDSQGDVFAVSAQAVVYDATNNQALGLCYALNAKGGATTITINFPSGSFTGAAIQEYSGIAASGALDAAVASMGAGSTAANAVTSGNATTLTANDLIFGAALDDSGGMAAFTAGTGYTLREQPAPANLNSMATEDQVQTSAGSIAATFSENKADPYLALLAAFKTSGGGAPPDTTPPTAAITSPANGATVSGTITVSGTAADNVAVANVQVSIDGGAFQTASLSSPGSASTNWTFNLNTAGLANASHAISAKATDTSGNVSTVASITVTVNNAAPPPAPVITSALSATGTTGTAFSYQIAASNSPTSFNATGLPAGLTVNTSNGLISGTPTAAGSSNVTISAANSGGTGTATLALTINAAPNTIPPTVAITSPANGATLSGTVAVGVSATDNVGVTKLEMYLGSLLVATDTAAPYAFTWDTRQVPNGTYTLTAKGYDAAGNVGTASIGVAVQNRHVHLSLVLAPAGFTVAGFSGVSAVSPNTTMALFTVEVNRAGEPTFPLAPTLNVSATLPSGTNVNVSLSQLSGNPSVYYAQLPKGQFSKADFAMNGAGMTIMVGTQTFLADGGNNKVYPTLGGTITDPNGMAGVSINANSLTQPAQVTISGAPGVALPGSNGVKGLGSAETVQIVTSGTVTSATLALAFDPTQVSSGMTVGMSYLSPQDVWMPLNNVTASGGLVQAPIYSDTGNLTVAAVLILPSSAPGLRNSSVFPNPAVRTDPTIRAFLGQVSSVEVTIFDASGQVVNSASLGGTPTGIAKEYYYDYTWTGHKASGIYFAVIHGKAADGTIIRARTRFAVVM